MSEPVDLLGTYLHLVRASGLRGRLLVRDRLLVLAGVHAADLGLRRIAAYCRHCVLAHNPQHYFRRWSTVEAALADPDFLYFLRHLHRRYPRERAERMLDALGIERGCERAAYYSDEEYAAALLGIRLDQLEESRGEDGS